MTTKSVDSRIPMWRRFLLPILIAVIAIVAAAINWTTEFTSEVLLPQFGTSAKAVLGRMIGFLAVGALLFWLLVTRQVSWKFKTICLASVLAVVAAGILSIREIENTGNNNYVIRFRWQPTQDQRLAEYQQSIVGKESEPVVLDALAPRFTDFLGPSRNGIVPGSDLRSNLQQQPPREVWRRPVGGGYAGFVIAGGLAVTIEQRNDEEAIVAMDMQTGIDRWARTYAGHFKELMGGNGPRATPTVADDEVFALGAQGLLVALDLASGREKWKTNILKDANADNIEWGMSGSPLVTQDLVVVNPGGGQGSAVIAYERLTGEIVWRSGEHEAGYASPVLANLAGEQQILIFDAKGVAGHALSSGQELWRFAFPTFNGINVGQPLALPNDQVLISAGYNSGAVLLQVSREGQQWKTDVVWRNKRLKCKMGSVIYHNGYLYGLDDGILACLDAQTGERLWKAGRYGHGQMLLRNDLLIIMAESGDLVLVEASPEAHRQLASIPILPGGKTWNAPALADDWLLLRNHFEAVLLEMASDRYPG
jgi:outer membrane protein assembly factor BamB